MFYPNGQLYCKEYYALGYQCDTNTFYSEEGFLAKRVVWITSRKFVTYFYTKNGSLRKKYRSRYPNKKSPFPGHKFTNLIVKEKKYYYDPTGRKISKSQYYDYYGDDKNAL